MKTLRNCLVAVLTATCLFSTSAFAQEETETESPFSVGADIYSNYVWRGTKFGTGPAFQPSVKFATGGLTIGAWGSYDAAGYAEADLYLSYGFDFGLSLGVTDYYYPGSDYTNLSDTAGSHAFEINAGYAISAFSISANYIVNEAGGAASVGGDMYFEAKYAFTNFSVFAGVGNGWHTVEGFKADGVTIEDDEFGLCNLGLSTSKEVKITDSFSLPVNGSVIWNPHAKQFTMVVGLSF
jgi:uncharacterized protein (TIGR02001 family)